jgi:hypothetical protein
MHPLPWSTGEYNMHICNPLFLQILKRVLRQVWELTEMSVTNNGMHLFIHVTPWANQLRWLGVRSNLRLGRLLRIKNKGIRRVAGAANKDAVSFHTTNLNFQRQYFTTRCPSSSRGQFIAPVHHKFLPSFFKTSFNIILPSTPVSSKRPIPFRFSDQNFVFLIFPCVLHVSPITSSLISSS